MAFGLRRCASSARLVAGPALASPMNAAPGESKPPRVDVWRRFVEHRPRPEGVSWLDATERSRAAGFRYERDRTRFLGRRIFLREVLAEYLAVLPGQVQLQHTRHGRPALCGPGDLMFNASHSDGTAVVAVTHRHTLGIDLERLRPLDDPLGLARRLFCESELEWLRAKPRQEHADGFLTIWTRKESVVKAMGQGLTTPLDSFDVSTADGGVGRPLQARGRLPYTFVDLEALPGFAGAVTVEGARTWPIVSMVRPS